MSSGSAPSMQRCCHLRIDMRLPLIWVSSLVITAGLDPSKAALIRRQGPKIEFQNSAGIVEFDGGGTGAAGQILLNGGAAQKQASAKSSEAPRVVFQNHPGTIVFGNGNGAHSGSSGGPSRIVFNDSPKEIVFGGGGGGSMPSQSSQSSTVSDQREEREERKTESSAVTSPARNTESKDKESADVGVERQPTAAGAEDVSKQMGSLEEQLINQDKKLGKRLDALEQATNAKVQRLEDDIHLKFGKIKDSIPPAEVPVPEPEEVVAPVIVDPVSGTSRRAPSRRRRTRTAGDGQIDERVAGLEEYISEQAREMTVYSKEMESLQASKAEQDTRIVKLENRLKSVQGDVGSIDLSPQSAEPSQVVVPAAPAAESSLGETKAELNAQMEAIRNTIATFEVDTRAKMEAMEKSLTGQYTKLEARVAVNEGKLRGVKENSLGGALR